MTSTIAPPRAAGTRRGRSGLAYCVKVYVAVRVGLFALGLLATALIPPASRNAPSGWPVPAGVPGWPASLPTPGWHNIFTAWERWDSLWFLRISSSGYSTTDKSAAFFPGYPMASRVVSFITGGHPLLGAYLVSNVALIVALYLIYRLTEFEFDGEMARRTVALIAVFPTALFLFAPYSESLFLALSVGAFYAARRGQWWAATALGALTTATRSIGVVVALAIAVEALRQELARRRSPGTRRWVLSLGKGVLVGAGSGLGLMAYFGWWWWKVGDPLTPFRAQSGWQRQWSGPWATLYDGTADGFRWIGQYSGGYQTVDFLAVALAVAATIWVLARAPAMYKLYTVVYLLFPLILVWPGRPFMSMPRFIVVLLPIFWAFASFTRRFNTWTATVATFAGGLGVCSLLFVGWFWIY